MDVDRNRPPTKEQFEQFCRHRVPRIVAALQGSILAHHVYKAVSAEHMPMWVKSMLFGVYKPQPVAQRVASKKKIADGRQAKPRRRYKAEYE